MDSRNPGSSYTRQHQMVALGVALVILGLLLVFAFPSDRLPWQTKGYTQAAPDCGATTGTIVCVQPPSQLAETGAQFTADIVADKVTNLGAYEFTLTFDPAVISLAGVTSGAFLGSTGRPVNCLGPILLGEGSVRFACVTVGSEPNGPDGTGVLARVRFSALAPGTSTLALTTVILADISGTPLPHTDVDGQVTTIVGPTATPCPGGICPTSTATSLPTATATPSIGPTVVRVEPPSQTLLVGSTVTVAVAVDAVTNLGAYEFILAFDPSVLGFVSVSDGSFLHSTGRTVFCPPPTIGVNTVRFGCATSGPTPDGPGGSGVLAVLVFTASNAGTGNLHLFNVGLGNPQGTDIPAAVQDGTVTVTLAATPTPTPCPGGICPTPTITPTRTATATPTATPLPVSCAEEAGATVCVLPPSLFVAPGTDFSVDVVVDEVSNLGGYQFTLAFNPNVIALRGVSNGPFLGSTRRTVSCLDPTPGVGSVHFACTTLGPAPGGPNGSGVLATVRFLALAEGSSPLELQDVILADILATPIPVNTQDSAVAVSSGPTPTPLPTATPTRTSTPGPSPTPGGTLVLVDPSSQEVPVGADLTVDISIERVVNLGSYEWLLTFDPAIVEFVSVSNADFLESSGRTLGICSTILDTGSVRFGCATTGPTPPGPNGAGVLSTLTFSALATGTSPLHLDPERVQLSDPLAENIPTALQDGAVTVVTEPTATATPTVAPTVGAPLSPGSTDHSGGLGTDQRGDRKLLLVSRLLGSFIAVIGASIAWYGRPRAKRR